MAAGGACNHWPAGPACYLVITPCYLVIAPCYPVSRPRSLVITPLRCGASTRCTAWRWGRSWRGTTPTPTPNLNPNPDPSPDPDPDPGPNPKLALILTLAPNQVVAWQPEGAEGEDEPALWRIAMADGEAACSKRPPWQCPRSAPAPPQGAPASSGWLEYWSQRSS